MRKKEVILCDTNILLGFLRRDQMAVDRLFRVTEGYSDWSRLAISVITYGEILPSSKKRDRKATRDFLNLFQLVELDRAGSKLVKSYFNTETFYSGMISDALIAATAVSSGLKIWTLNRSDFVRFKGVRLVHQIR
ncbi:PIN domain-containing protein [Tunicatimonas pelagia]|uniref:PIN domain-containing protein n=1 Tax=Tunicatimonas pelagia TaxID=931531 RepID=UPI002665EFA0|nr:PIN domain-containing protein [Tunicatimonas pelagia]WKN42091.1 PIN domain-containing protein [Tunicatimonas pelagia]